MNWVQYKHLFNIHAEYEMHKTDSVCHWETNYFGIYVAKKRGGRNGGIKLKKNPEGGGHFFAPLPPPQTYPVLNPIYAPKTRTAYICILELTIQSLDKKFTFLFISSICYKTVYNTCTVCSQKYQNWNIFDG